MSSNEPRQIPTGLSGPHLTGSGNLPISLNSMRSVRPGFNARPVTWTYVGVQVVPDPPDSSSNELRKWCRC